MHASMSQQAVDAHCCLKLKACHLGYARPSRGMTHEPCIHARLQWPTLVGGMSYWISKGSPTGSSSLGSTFRHTSVVTSTKDVRGAGPDASSPPPHCAAAPPPLPAAEPDASPLPTSLCCCCPPWPGGCASPAAACACGSERAPRRCCCSSSCRCCCRWRRSFSCATWRSMSGSVKSECCCMGGHRCSKEERHKRITREGPWNTIVQLSAKGPSVSASTFVCL